MDFIRNKPQTENEKTFVFCRLELTPKHIVPLHSKYIATTHRCSFQSMSIKCLVNVQQINNKSNFSVTAIVRRNQIVCNSVLKKWAPKWKWVRNARATKVNFIIFLLHAKSTNDLCKVNGLAIARARAPKPVFQFPIRFTWSTHSKSKAFRSRYRPFLCILILSPTEFSVWIKCLNKCIVNGFHFVRSRRHGCCKCTGKCTSDVLASCA